jgi:zinc/manganese transport system permease protein
MTGFLQSGPVHVALEAATVTAVVSGLVGVLVVVRGQSFAGHAMGDLGTLGGSSAYLANVNPLWGFVGVGAVVAGAMELVGVQRRRSRDVATGVVLGAALGISALLLYLDTTSTSTTGATITVLFGSLFAVSPGSVPVMAGLALGGALALAVVYRPLLLASVHPELASIRGVRVRVIAFGFLVLVGVTVSLTSMVVGTILSPALLVGPAAVALRVSRRPPVAMAVAAGLGIAATWGGVTLAYASYTWPPAHAGWPISFFVVALIFVAFVATELPGRLARLLLCLRPLRLGGRFRRVKGERA